MAALFDDVGNVCVVEPRLTTISSDDEARSNLIVPSSSPPNSLRLCTLAAFFSSHRLSTKLSISWFVLYEPGNWDKNIDLVWPLATFSQNHD